MGFLIGCLLGTAMTALACAWWVKTRAQTSADDLAKRARTLYELAEGDIDNVAAELEESAQAAPGDVGAFLALAALDRRRGRLERAKAIHRTVLAGSDLAIEERVAALVGLGRDLLAQGNERAAVGALVRAISLAPRSVATLETLARALERAGAWERAAAAWERHEKLVEGRRRRASRVGRGHAIAGLAAQAMREGAPDKAQRLAERAVELAPDSGHVWTARARVEAASNRTEETLAAWQRAWELAPAAAHVIVAEANRWAKHADAVAGLMPRMLATLRSTPHPRLIVELSTYVSSEHADPVATALERVASRSAEAALALVRLRMSQGQRDLARQAALADVEPAGLVCEACGDAMDRFRFRCDACGSWDSAMPIGSHRTTYDADDASRVDMRLS